MSTFAALSTLSCSIVTNDLWVFMHWLHIAPRFLTSVSLVIKAYSKAFLDTTNDIIGKSWVRIGGQKGSPDLPQQAVLRSGDQFRKGHSRSKKLTGCEPNTPKNWRWIKTYEQRGFRNWRYQAGIDFKDKRCKAASTVKNYKACNSLTDIVALKACQREFEAELKLFEHKEQKSKWYHRMKSYKSVIQSSESEYDPISVPLQ